VYISLSADNLDNFFIKKILFAKRRFSEEDPASSFRLYAIIQGHAE
jgi:hypothetical protein